MIIPAAGTLTNTFDNLAVPIIKYFKIIEMAECAGFGVNNPADVHYSCSPIWSKQNRDLMQQYLLEAQEEIEQVVGYPLTPRWFANEQQYYSYPVKTRWGKVIEAGVKATTDISLGVVVDHTADPAVIGPVVTTVTDEDEIFVYHPGTDIEIVPSAVTISGGNVTIQIPRCRMVKTALVDNDGNGLDYDDTSNFEATVDIKRVYNDASTNATLVWPHRCGASCAANGCSEYTQTACMYIRNSETGAIDVQPATYSDGTWTGTTVSCCNGNPQIVRLNYRAGLTPLTQQAENAIIRLAHAKLPYNLCGCDMWDRMWERDRAVPDVLTRERLNNPFGLSNGAWVAWQFAKSMPLIRGYVL